MLPIESMRQVLDAALTNGGDLAEIYLENTERLSLTLDEGRLEEATQGNDIGGGRARLLWQQRGLRLHRRPQPGVVD